MTTRKKICWSCLLFGAFVLIIVAILTSCLSTTTFSEVKEIPVVKKGEHQVYSLYDRYDFGFRFGHQVGHNSVKIKVPKDIEMLLLDAKYRDVDYFFFRKFNNWFKDVKFENGIMPINQKENLDCDNFALLYKSLFSAAFYKSGLDHEPAVGLVVVEQKNEFGGIPKGALHMVNIVFTRKAWYIFEPQTGKYIELENYPNQEYIRFIMI